jgi:hypothetical protein
MDEQADLEAQTVADPDNVAEPIEFEKTEEANANG